MFEYYYLDLLAMSVLGGLWITIRAKLPFVARSHITGWRARTAGVFLVIPVVSLLALISFDPLLFPYCWGLFGTATYTGIRLNCMLGHVVTHAGFLLPLCVFASVLWVAFNLLRERKQARR